VDFNKRMIYELKPNNPRQITAGWKQLNKYKAAFESQYGGLENGFRSLLKKWKRKNL